MTKETIKQNWKYLALAFFAGIAFALIFSGEPEVETIKTTPYACEQIILIDDSLFAEIGDYLVNMELYALIGILEYETELLVDFITEQKELRQSLLPECIK